LLYSPPGGVCSPDRGVSRYSESRFLISDNSVSSEREEGPPPPTAVVAMGRGLATILQRVEKRGECRFDYY